MSNYKHGIHIIQQPTAVSTPVVASSGIPFVVGTAPIHQVGGKVQQVVMAMSYEEAATQLGYSDHWESYSLCEVVYSQFRLFGTAPLFLVNVLDPEKHNKKVASESVLLTDGQGILPFEAIKETVQIKAGGTLLQEGEDYLLFYSENQLVLELLSSGDTTTTEVTASYTAVDPTLVTKEDILGGYDLATGTNTGLELINDVFPKFSYIPDLLSCPRYSHHPEVAALMAAKMEAINGAFSGHVVLDADSKEVSSYRNVPEWKKENNIFHPRQIVCWPKAKLGDRVFHLSTLALGRMGATDSREECPTESPSNEEIFINGLILDDEEHTEVVIDEPRGNFLNQNGIVTATRFSGGFVLWGNETACFPGNTDIKDYFINISRMFSWTGNTIIHTLRSKIDRNIKVRVVENIVNDLNKWLNGLVSEGKILGGRVEFRQEENDELNLLSGVVRLHFSLGFSPPMKAIDAILEYDAGYLSTLYTVAN